MKSCQEPWLQTSDHSPFPLLIDLLRTGHIDGFFFFPEGLDLPRSSFCAFCHQTLILAGTTWLTCLPERWSSWTNPPGPGWSPALPSCLWAPSSAGAPRSCPHCSAESPPSTPRSPEGQLAAAGNGSSWPKLPALPGWWQRNCSKMAKELQQIMEIGSFTCYVFKMACDVTGCAQWF